MEVGLGGSVAVGIGVLVGTTGVSVGNAGGSVGVCAGASLVRSAMIVSAAWVYRESGTGVDVAGCTNGVQLARIATATLQDRKANQNNLLSFISGYVDPFSEDSLGMTIILSIRIPSISTTSNRKPDQWK